MPAPTDNRKTSVLAVLRQAREAGVGPVTRTALFKLVYLLDCLHAETHDGEIASGADWYFHHYGPYATDLAVAVDEMARFGLIKSKDGEFKDKEFVLYSLGEYPLGPELAEVGLNPSLAIRFNSLIRGLSKDLAKLLDYTYFKTLPMQGAVPGKCIDFGVFKGMDQVKPFKHTTIVDHAKILKIAELRHKLVTEFELGEGNSRAMAAHRPIYDSVFYDAMAAWDQDDQEQAPIPFRATLA